MRVSNADFVAREINDYRTEVERKLKGMVAQFAYEASLAISDHIPIGDALSLAMGLESKDPKDPTAAYANYYKNRKRKYSIDTEVGFHKGALRYSEDGDFSTLITEIKDTTEMANDVFHAAISSYNIGDTFYIGAKGPGYTALESGSSEQAPSGFIQPSEQAIIQLYSSDMKRMYDSVE